MSDHMDF